MSQGDLSLATVDVDAPLPAELGNALAALSEIDAGAVLFKKVCILLPLHVDPGPAPRGVDEPLK